MCVVPTSAGVVAEEASLLDGLRYGEFPTALCSIRGFRPDDDDDDDDEEEED